MSLKTDIYASKMHRDKNSKKVNATNKKRVREPVTPSKGKVVGYFPSIKNGESIAWESQLELRACRIFEYSDFIQSYREQPTVVHYKLDGIARRYFPDFELLSLNGELIYVEIKPKHILEIVGEKAKFAQIAKTLENEGVGFAVMTEEELDKDFIQDNLKLIHPYRTVKVNKGVISILRAAKISGVFSVVELIEIGFSIGTIYSMIAKKYLKTNLKERITKNTHLFIEKESDHENSIFSCRTAPDFK